MHSDYCFQYLASDYIVKGKSVNIIILQSKEASAVLSSVVSIQLMVPTSIFAAS